MTGSSATREGVGLVGLGVAACAACCAGPILAFLGGLTIAGLASTLVIGVAGLAIALVAGTAWFIVRRRRRNACRDGAAGGPVSVASPTARAPR